MIWSSLNLAFSSVFQLDLMHKPTRTKFVTNINMHGYVILIDLFDLFIVFDDLANKQKQYNTNNTNPAKTKVLIISKPHISHPVLTFNNIDLSETDSYKYLGLIFHRTLSWHHHILSIKQKTTLRLNGIKQLSHLVPRKVLHTLCFLCSPNLRLRKCDFCQLLNFG